MVPQNLDCKIKFVFQNDHRVDCEIHPFCDPILISICFKKKLFHKIREYWKSGRRRAFRKKKY